VSNNAAMHAIFPVVLFGSIALFVVMGVLSMLTRNNLYDQIGQGGLTLGEDQRGGRSPVGAGTGDSDALEAESRAEREQEIRQMLQARSDRLVRRGQPPLDLDAELAKLEHAGALGSGALGAAGGPGTHDAGLTEEVRQLVLARNERRRRQGQAALDVEVEVARTLAELDP
jgi:hypothetical protein